MPVHQLRLSEHKLNAENADYRSHLIGPNTPPEEPVISPGVDGEFL
jgi:hypothetical protein